MLDALADPRYSVFMLFLRIRSQGRFRGWWRGCEKGWVSGNCHRKVSVEVSRQATGHIGQIGRATGYIDGSAIASRPAPAALAVARFDAVAAGAPHPASSFPVGARPAAAAAERCRAEVRPVAIEIGRASCRERV